MRRPIGLRSQRRWAAAGFTLVELLIIIVLLGLAGSMVIPAMSQAGALRIQASVRTIVSDIAYMQSDALADQSPRVIVFGRLMRQTPGGVWESVPGNGYTLYAPPPGAAAVDLDNDWIVDPDRPDRPWARDLDDAEFAGARIDMATVDFEGVVGNGDRLIFDALGGPVTAPDVNLPAPTGSMQIVSSSTPPQRFRIEIEAYTGRVVVQRLE